MTEPVTASADPWPDHIRLSDIEHRFVCEACGKRGADVRPDSNPFFLVSVDAAALVNWPLGLT